MRRGMRKAQDTAPQPLLGAASAPVWGEYRPHTHTSRQNLVNLTLALVALVPSFAATSHLYTHCSSAAGAYPPLSPTSPSAWSSLLSYSDAGWCALAMEHPIWYANAAPPSP